MHFLNLLLLLVSHTGNVVQNITTNEFINYRKYPHFYDNNGKYHNPFDYGISKNIMNFLHRGGPGCKRYSNNNIANEII